MKSFYLINIFFWCKRCFQTNPVHCGKDTTMEVYMATTILLNLKQLSSDPISTTAEINQGSQLHLKKNGTAKVDIGRQKALLHIFSIFQEP